MIKTIFNDFFYQPLFSALIFLHENIPGQDLGIAIIVLTILIRIILLPLFYKGAKDQAIMQRLAPKVKEIQKNHKDDKEKQAKALMDLYREHKVNPLSQFLLILIQLPILIALYLVFFNGIKEIPDLNYYFLGAVDLSKSNWPIIILAALAQYFQGKLSLIKSQQNSKDKGELSAAEIMTKQMIFIGPIITIVFLIKLPSAVGLYWLTTSIFSAIQQIWINKRLAKADDKKLIEIDKKLHHGKF